MSNILHVLGNLDDAEKSHCIQTMIRVIMLERKLTEKGVGECLEPVMSQTTISRWANGIGGLPNDHHFQQLVRLFFGPWHYVCSFSEKYDASLPLKAREALFRTRANAPLNAQAPLASHPSIEIDLHMRPAKLVAGALAHTFANHSHNPSIFVILVRDDIPYEEQYRIGWEEVLAHVIQPKTKSVRGLSVEISIQQHFPDLQLKNADRNLVTVRGKLRKTTKGSHWLVVTETQKYLIVNSEDFQNEEWFSESCVVEATGELMGEKVARDSRAIHLEVRSLRRLN
jgi:hypothetical protein